MKPLTQNDIDRWKESLQLSSKLENIITERISYIIEFWMEAFGGKLNSWYLDDAPEGQVGNLSDHMDDKTIHSFEWYCSVEPTPNTRSGDMVIIDKYENKFRWGEEIPTRWLFEDFEQEIVQGKLKYELRVAQASQRNIERKAKASLEKKTNDILVAQAKAKLSEEELAALKKVL